MDFCSISSPIVAAVVDLFDDQPIAVVSLVNMYSAHSVLTVFNLYLVAMYGMEHTQFETFVIWSKESFEFS